MNRGKNIQQIRSRKKPWDIIVIGGGATGLGIAVDAAARNYSVLLLERYDFAKGTSSRSTKLIHGGIRYLQQGNISLVMEALRERGIIKKNAPHLIKDLSFVIPAYEWWDGPFYIVGLKLYDLMAGRLGLGSSRYLNRQQTLEAISTIDQEGLRGGVIYHDGQFDDARMAISLALTADDYGAVLVNYMKVVNIRKEDGIASGVDVVDMETGDDLSISGKVVVNAAGVFADDVIRMDNPLAKRCLKVSQGVHVVVDKEFLPGNYAFLIPQTSDGRILFAVPWHDKVILGTTDTPIAHALSEPRPLREEVNFILENAAKYLSKKPDWQDIRSVFTGLRPLVVNEGSFKSTKEMSRGHKVTVSDSGLVSVIGGKWTTYRKMGEDAVNYAILVGNLEERRCISENLLLHGYANVVDFSDPLHVYGGDLRFLISIERERPEYAGVLSQLLHIKRAQVVWAARKEMARTVEDVLARRTRALFLDARESIRIAHDTALLLAMELRKETSWVDAQVKEFTDVAKNYLPDP